VAETAPGPVKETNSVATVGSRATVADETPVPEHPPVPTGPVIILTSEERPDSGGDTAFIA